jgi:chemotaxis protein histidine kinase CheA
MDEDIENSGSTLIRWPFYFANALILGTVVFFVSKADQELSMEQVAICVFAVALSAMMFFVPHLVEYFIAISAPEESKASSGDGLLQKTYLELEGMKETLSDFGVKLEKVPSIVESVAKDALANGGDSPDVSGLAQEISDLRFQMEQLVAKPNEPSVDPRITDIVAGVAALEQRVDRLAEILSISPQEESEGKGDEDGESEDKELADNLAKVDLILEQTQALPEDIDEEEDLEDEETDSGEDDLDEESSEEKVSKEESTDEISFGEDADDLDEETDDDSIDDSDEEENDEEFPDHPEEEESDTDSEEDDSTEEEDEESDDLEEDQDEEELPDHPEEEESDTDDDEDDSTEDVDEESDDLEEDEEPEDEEPAEQLDLEPDSETEEESQEESDESGDDEPSEPVGDPPGVLKGVSQSDVVVAKILPGIGNKVHVRGEGPGLSWDQGVSMSFQEIGKWGWSPSDKSASLVVQLYRNDEEPDRNGKVELEPGEKVEITPIFDE